jgi:hypothetical protein
MSIKFVSGQLTHFLCKPTYDEQLKRSYNMALFRRFWILNIARKMT